MLFGTDSDVTDAIIGCAIEVHKELGPGLLESVYEAAICVELEDRGLSVARQVGVPLYYKGRLLSEHRPDLVVSERVIVEIKCVQHIEPVHVAQLITYLRVKELETGLLLNFKTAVMRHGIRRIRVSRPAALFHRP